MVKTKFNYRKKSNTTPPKGLPVEDAPIRRSSPRKTGSRFSGMFADDLSPIGRTLTEETGAASPESKPAVKRKRTPPRKAAVAKAKRTAAAGRPAAAAAVARPSPQDDEDDVGSFDDDRAPSKRPPRARQAALAQKKTGVQKRKPAGPAHGHATMPLDRAPVEDRRQIGRMTSILRQSIEESRAGLAADQLAECLKQFGPVAAAILQDLADERRRLADQYAKAVAPDIKARVRLLRELKETLDTEKLEWDDFKSELYTNKRLVDLATFRCQIDSVEKVRANLSVEMAELIASFEKEMKKESSIGNELQTLSMQFDTLVPVLRRNMQDASQLSQQLAALQQEYVESFAKEQEASNAKQLVKNFISHGKRVNKK